MSVEIRIPNIRNYYQTIINGDLILTPIGKYITEDELYLLPFKNAIIETCLIKKDTQIMYDCLNESSVLKCLRTILIKLWETMPTQKILQTTTFNFKLINDTNYKWCPEINIFFQERNIITTLKEIINMIKINKMIINLTIKVNSDNVVYFKI